MRFLLVASTVMFTALGAVAQLPAGTRDAADTSRTDAANAKLRDAEAALEKGDYAAAVKTLQALAAERPKDGQILYDLGFAEERIGDDDAASKAYEGAIAASPDVVEPRVALGLLDARAGRTDKAHGELSAAAQLETAAPQLRGRAYRALAQLDESADPAGASDELLAAIKLTGETPADTALSATLAEHAGDKSGAEAAYRRALALHADDAEAAAGLAHILQQTGHAAEAEAALAEPLKAHPDDPRLVSQMASIYAAEGKTKEAIPLLVQLRADPKFAADSALTRQLARLYALDGENAEAEGMFKAALVKEPQDPALLDDLGSVLVRQQKYAEAVKILSEAVALRDSFPDPADFGEAAGHLAFAASKNGQPRECLQALSLRATVLPNSAPSLFLEATAHDTLHEYKEAERAYRAFLAIAAGQFPDQEFQAKHRLIALEHTK
jgi:Flp pilus assembly protein TadD